MIRVYASIAAILAAFAGGYATHRYISTAEANKAALEQSETNRESERLASQAQARVTDQLTADRLAAVRAASGLRDRLREQSEAGASSPAATACGNDEAATAARILPSDIGSDLVSLMESAEEVSARLAACQRRLDL